MFVKIIKLYYNKYQKFGSIIINIYRNKTNNNSWYDYYLDDGKNRVGIIFSDNGDLYFCSLNNKKDTEVYITKENMVIYSLFNELFNDFENARVFNIDKNELQFCDNEEEINKKHESVNRRNMRLKSSSLYKQLFCNDTITWISDNSCNFDIKSSNSLRIIKEDDKLKFTYCEDKSDIRICTSGSRYTPFNTIMMKFFNKLQEYDSEYHQTNLEEYFYIKKYNS